METNIYWNLLKDLEMKEIVAECKPYKKSHICRMDDFLEDAQAKVLTPKRYEMWLRKKVDGMQGSYFKKPYLEKLVRLLDKSGRRNDAIEVMEAWKGSDDLRMLYIDMLIEWKMYDEALEVMDLSQERGVFLEDYNQKTLDVMHAWPMSAGRFDIGSLDTYYEAVDKYGK